MAYYVTVWEARNGRPFDAARRAELLDNDARALIAEVTMCGNQTSPKWNEVLPKIDIPCLLFAGEADPTFPLAKQTATLTRGAQFVSFPGLDHIQAFFDRTDLVLPIVMEFLAEVNGGT